MDTQSIIQQALVNEIQQSIDEEIITSISTTTSTTTSTGKQHRCYDLCEHWRGAIEGCCKGHPSLIRQCKDFSMWEEIRIENKGW